MKYTLIALAFIAILACLASAVFFMNKNKKPGDQVERNRNMARVLGWRVALSIGLFVCLLLAYKFGYIRPTGIPISAS